jgi:Tol biopolymer transport system component
VRFVDRPSSGQPAGLWAVDLTGGSPALVTTRLGLYSLDETRVAYLESGQTYVEQIGGPRWRVDNGGRAVVFSPDSTQIAWQVASSPYNFDRRRVTVWVAQADGTGARKIVDLVGGTLAGWFPDSRRLLVTSRDANHTVAQAVTVADSGLSLLASGARLDALALSPGGGWLAYTVTFSGEPGQDGLWMVPIAPSPAAAPAARRLEVFGGFAWRAEGRLLVIPLDAEAASQRVLEVTASSGAARPVVEPAAAPIQIAQGDWAVAPDGRHLAFVSAADHNIWVVDLTE